MDDYLLLLDVCHKDQRAIGLFDFHNGRSVRAYSEHGGLYETLLFCSRRHLGWSEHCAASRPTRNCPRTAPSKARCAHRSSLGTTCWCRSAKSP